MAANQNNRTVFSRLADLFTSRRPPREIDLRPIACAASILVSDLYQHLERDYVINGRRSLVDLRMRWRKHLKEVFAEIPATSLTTQQVSAYTERRLEEKASNATVNRELSLLKRAYKLAIIRGVLKSTEMPYIAMLRERNTRKGFLKDEDYADLAHATGEVGLYLRALFEIGFTYGWRRHELISMRVAQVDMNERLIRLNPEETKNCDARTVEMTLSVYKLLQALVAGKSPEEKVFTKGRRNRFGTSGKNPIGSFRKAWARATKAAGCEGLLFHDLRRSAIRNMLRCGIPEKVAMEIAGMKTRSIVDRYHIVSGDDLHKAVGLMELAADSRGYHSVASGHQQADLPFEDVAPRKSPASADTGTTTQTPEDRSRIAAKAAQTRWSREKRPA
jgi:integrase